MKLLYSFPTSLSSTCSAITSSVPKSMWVGYGKIPPNRGRYNRKGLCRLYSSFCAPAVSYLSGFAFLLRKKDTKKIRSGYFKYCKYLLRLPRWYRSHTVVSKFDIIDAPSRLKRLSEDISLKTQQMMGVFDPLWPFFWIEVIYLYCMLLCCYVIYVLCFFLVFSFFLCVHSTVLCILWVINK